MTKKSENHLQIRILEALGGSDGCERLGINMWRVRPYGLRFLLCDMPRLQIEVVHISQTDRWEVISCVTDGDKVLEFVTDDEGLPDAIRKIMSQKSMKR